MFQKDPEKPQRVAFYVRVSTEEQVKEGFWIEMQLAWLNEMITYKNKYSKWVTNPNWVYKDLGCSGKDLNRPGYKALIKDVEAGKFDVVAVWKIDRMSRNLTHLLGVFETLQSHKVSFFSLKENIDFSGPIGKLTFQIFGALAEFERETIAMRTREGKLQSARQGNFVINTAPYGYVKDDKSKKENRGLILVEKEVEWVKRVFEEFIGGKSYSSIAKILNENNIRKGEGNGQKNKTTKWYASDIRNIVSNPAYSGRAVYNVKNESGETESVSIPVIPIISPLTFELAQNHIQEIDDGNKSQWGETEYLLSRKVVDVETGRNLIAYTRTKDGRPNYRRKKFTLEGKIYENYEIPGDALEKEVWKLIYQKINAPEKLYEIFKKQSIDSRDYDAYLKERDKLQRECDSSEDMEIDIELWFRKWELSDDKKDKMIAKIIQEREAKLKRIVELDQKLDTILHAQEIKMSLQMFKEWYSTNLENLSLKQKQFLVKWLLQDILVTRTSRQINTEIRLRFELLKALWDDVWDEPKKLSADSVTEGKELDLCWNGATDRTWTCDLLLRREAF